MRHFIFQGSKVVNCWFYIQWYENVWPRVGSYKAVYMFDYQNLIMIEAYTYKKGLHDDDYHRI